MEAAEDAAEDAVEAEDAVDAALSPIQRCGGIDPARLVYPPPLDQQHTASSWMPAQS